MTAFSQTLPSTLTLLLAATSLAAQARPDFSGRWVLAPAGSVEFGGGGNRVGMGGGGGGGGGAGLGAPADMEIITQDDTTMKVQLGDDGPFSVYRLDGKRAKNSVLAGAGRVSEATYVSKWEGQKLVTTITRSMGTREVRNRETRSLDKDGNMLVEIRVEMAGPTGSIGRRTFYQKAPTN